jgi:hypothetical protein
MKNTVWAFVAMGLLSAPAAGAEHPSTNRHTGLVETPLAGLRKAAERGDRAELGRQAARIGVARLARALADPDRGLVLAALDSAPYAPGRLLLLDAVLARCDSADASIRERALRTVGVLLDGADPELLGAWEVPIEIAQTACGILAASASRRDRTLDARLAALQSLADAGALCAGKNDLQALLRDPSPDIRRAGILVIAPTNPQALSALREAIKDPDPGVAAAAGVALCREQHVPRLKPNPAPTPPWRGLVVAQSTPAEDAAEMLTCLTESNDPSDAKVLEDLRAKGSPMLLPKR